MISKKAFRQSALISRCFISKNSFNLKLAFCTYVRPIVEYASQVWSPYIQKDIDLLENVQRRFTKSIPKLHYLPYTTRLTILHIPSLFCQRNKIDRCRVNRILRTSPYLHHQLSSHFVCSLAAEIKQTCAQSIESCIIILALIHPSSSLFV